MKKMNFGIALLAVCVMCVGCGKDRLGKKSCLLNISFVESVNSKAYQWEVPDTNEFILSVVNEGGASIYNGRYCEKPKIMEVSEGTYTISVVSFEFSKPGFDLPQYGDNQTIVVGQEKSVNVSLMCKQLNSGLKISYSSSFKKKFSSSTMLISSGEDTLKYPFEENRIAFFKSGRVELNIDTAGEKKFLLSRNIAPAEVLLLNLSAAIDDSEQAYGIVIDIDTTRTWITDNVVAGEGSDGSSKEKSFSVLDAMGRVGAEAVWVKGYVVGGDLTSTGIKYSTPFSSKTNVAIADKPNENVRSNCLSVELKSGEIRDTFNLVDHPEMLGKVVYLQGNIVSSYFGLVGIKSLKEFVHL